MKEILYDGNLRVKIDSLSYAWGSARNQASLVVQGRVDRVGKGLNCRFRIDVTRKGHHLHFLTATTQDEEEDIQALAIDVKNALVSFLSTSDEVPEAHRQKLKDCVLNHHLQKKVQK